MEGNSSPHHSYMVVSPNTNNRTINAGHILHDKEYNNDMRTERDTQSICQ